MVVAEEYAKQQALLVPAGSECVGRLTGHVELLLKELPQLADELRSLDIDLISEKFDNDKKHHVDQYRIVVPKGNGALELVSVARTEQGRITIKKAYRAAIERLTKID
jgi:3-dehydroquinate synthase